MVKLIDHRKIRRNYFYTPADAAKNLKCSEKTVRVWISKGLPVQPGYPILMKGQDMKDYLKQRRKQKAKRCSIDELFCFSCHEPRYAFGKSFCVSKIHRTGGVHLRTHCPACGTIMSQVCARPKAERLMGIIDPATYSLN